VDIDAADAAALRLTEVVTACLDGCSRLPTEPLPYLRSIFNINLLGVDQWQHLFTPRQLLALTTLILHLRRAEERVRAETEHEFADALITILALAIDRQADYGSSLCRWVPTGEFIGNTFGRQALGIIWDFAETNPFGNGSGNFDGAVSWVAGVCDHVTNSDIACGHVEQASATSHPLPDDSVAAFVTDPPYYDSVPYADLSDFFYVWLKRSVGGIHPSILGGDLSPKELEVVQLAERNTNYSYKTKENFEALMVRSLTHGRRTTVPGGIGVVVFAHKATAAWETMLQAVTDAGWVITASWPIDTEMGARLRAKNSATLSSSVHLVCRPREDFDGSLRTNETGDWRQVLSDLPRRIHEWMPRLAEEGTVGADAIFACLGPALEIFSRFSRVERANGEPVSLREYLEQVWAAVSREALSMIFADPETSGLDEDARLTAMWLWTTAAPSASSLDENSDNESDDDEERSRTVVGFALEFDAARKIAQGLGARLEALEHVVEVKGDKARLLSAAERTKYLFGGSDSAPPTKKSKKKPQRALFEELEEVAEQQGWGEVGTPRAGSTTLDRVHQAMILFGSGRGEALKRFLVDEGVGGGAQFWKLAQALSALYPTGTDEKRWVDGVMARKKGLGF
jgi:adenine-specific DNA methylase